jgi:hypothetical protein
MSRIITTFKKRQYDIPVTARHVIEKMENNPLFPDPPAALSELKIRLPEFEQALVDAMGGDKHLVAVKDNKKAIVVDLLQELVIYVTEICKGDKTSLLSSGFDVSDEGNGRGKLSSVVKLNVELGPPGEATTRVKNVSGARAYVHQYTKDLPGLNTEWIGEGWAQASYTFVGLVSDKRYWFRVVVIGSGTQRVYSPVVSMVIQ